MRHVIVELKHTEGIEEQATAQPNPDFNLDLRSVPSVKAPLHIDQSFAPVCLPDVHHEEPEHWDPFDITAANAVDFDPEASTYLVRGAIEDDAADDLKAEAEQSERIVGVYADPVIEPAVICPGAGPLGTSDDVARLLCADSLHARRMDGRGVTVAVVDTGFNVDYLRQQGLTPDFDAADSWAWDPNAVTPGSAPVDHGTMVAYDVMITAPRARLIDIALLHPVFVQPGQPIMEGLLSDAIRAFSHLLDIARRPSRPGGHRSLVVNNSWGMFHPSWDFPIDDERNYSDNPDHPFNRIVATLERAGADILFAAGNCGSDCPDNRCRGVTSRTIYGANGHPSVITVAGVDTTGVRVGYSSQGPGRLENRKPDLAGYTHFSGSGVYPADGGTSAASPVVAGVVAALRSRKPFDENDPSTRPSAMKNLLTATARDISPMGFDFDTGHGVVDACRAADRIVPPTEPPPEPPPPPPPPPPPEPEPRDPWEELCRRYPVLCDFLRRLFD